ncbi:MAG TPA: EVE domain-containing protein [Cytophagaceae bacterium]|jgi:predicted RNA-binding protein with PUA-like domain|nr:EVE domain-containing protein [Cytophagaceae bacterium]
MNYWLVKSEPTKYPYEQLEKDKSTVWDGVRNYAARNNLKAMKKGDLLLFYHSNEGKDVVGIAKVLKEFYPDPTAKEGDWVVVEIGPYKKLKKSITLEQIKADKILKSMELVRLSRLSVCPVRKEEFDRVLELSEIK